MFSFNFFVSCIYAGSASLVRQLFGPHTVKIRSHQYNYCVDSGFIHEFWIRYLFLLSKWNSFWCVLQVPERSAEKNWTTRKKGFLRIRWAGASDEMETNGKHRPLCVETTWPSLNALMILIYFCSAENSIHNYRTWSKWIRRELYWRRPKKHFVNYQIWNKHWQHYQISKVLASQWHQHY